MNLELVQQHWALLAGSVIGIVVVLTLMARIWQDSARGRLRGAFRTLQEQRREVARLERALAKAQQKLARLESRADAVPPRTIEEARGAVSDGEAMLKIRGDQVLVAQTRVRTIIYEEFPPRRHDALRHRYLEG